MRGRIFRVNAAGPAARRRPKITIQCGWLAEAGFVPGALVQGLPERGGLAFRLCDECAAPYSGLARHTAEGGGKLFQMAGRTDGGSTTPVLHTSGRYIQNAGLSAGDTVVEEHGYGLVRLRRVRLAPNERLALPAIAKDPATGGRRVRVRLCGKWLAEFGFGVGAVLSVRPGPGSLELRVEPPGDPVPLVRRARREGTKIVQMSDEPHGRNGPTPFVGMTGSAIDAAGFGFDDVLVVSCSQGRAVVGRLGPERYD